MKIVPADQIPKEVQTAPEGNLIELYKMCLKMENLCLESHGVGLSAVQVGTPWKLFIVRMDIPDRFAQRRGTKPLPPSTNIPVFRYFVNCEYEALDKKKYDSVEGCLSLLNEQGLLRHFTVPRYENIELKGKELVVEPDLALKDIHDRPPHSYFSTICQHEIDHQRLVLISDIGKETDVW